jgi:ornithine decarboxylase
MHIVTIEDARAIIADQPLNSRSFYISSPKFIENLVDKFREMLPRVVPHYALKCNDDEMLIKTFIKKGVHFDCASSSEIKKVINHGAKPGQIIFEINGVTVEQAQEAFRLAGHKMPIKCRFLARE